MSSCSSASYNPKKRSIILSDDNPIAKRRPHLVELSREVTDNQTEIVNVCNMLEKSPYLYNIFNMMMKLNITSRYEFSDILKYVKQTVYDEHNDFELVLNHPNNNSCYFRNNIHLIFSLLNNPKNVKSLTMKCHCVDVTDKLDILNLVSYCSNITKIDISNTYLNDETISQFFNSLEYLKNNVTDLTFHFLFGDNKSIKEYKILDQNDFNYGFWRDNHVLKRLYIDCHYYFNREMKYYVLYYRIFNELCQSDYVNISDLTIHIYYPFGDFGTYDKKMLLITIIKTIEKINSQGILIDLNLRLSTPKNDDFNLMTELFNVIFLESSKLKNLFLSICFEFVGESFDYSKYLSLKTAPFLETFFLTFNRSILFENTDLCRSGFLNLFLNLSILISSLENIKYVKLESNHFEKILNTQHINQQFYTFLEIILDLLKKNSIESLTIANLHVDLRGIMNSAYLSRLLDIVNSRNNLKSLSFNESFRFPDKVDFTPRFRDPRSMEIKNLLNLIDRKISENEKTQFLKQVSLLDLLINQNKYHLNHISNI